MYDELLKRLNVFRLKEDEYQIIPVYVSEIIGEAADAIEGLSHAVGQMTEWRKNPWIPVTERLPDQNSGNLYICLIVGGEYDQLSWYELCDFAEGQFWIRDQLYECHVTHWMPLPPAPKEE